MKKLICIRDSLKNFIISFSLYLLFIIYISIQATKELPDYNFWKALSEIMLLPYALLFFIPALYFLVLNIMYFLLFIVAKIKGMKCSAKIIDIEIKKRLLNPRSCKYRFIVKTSEGLIKRSFYYHINLEKFYDYYSRSECTLYYLKNIIFITSINVFK